MEPQKPRGAKGQHQLQSIGFNKSVYLGPESPNGFEKEGLQPDALSRLGKLPVLKVSCHLAFGEVE